MNLAQIEGAGKDDLIAELTKLKEKEKRVKASNAAKANKTVSAVVTVAAGAAGGYWMGSKRKEAEATEGFANKTEKEQQDLIAGAQQLVGVDADMLVGIAALGLGLTDVASDYSDMLLSAGAGFLASAASRMVEKKVTAPAEAAA